MGSRSITGIGIVGLVAWIILKPYINDSGLNWPESVPVNYVLIGIGAIAAGIALIKGTWQLSKDKNSVATKKFATGVWVVLITLAIAAMIFGPGAIDRARSDLREVGDNFANRSETSSPTSTRSPDRVNRTRGNFRTSTLGYLPVIVVYPGQKSQEIASYSNSCLDVEYVSGSSAYQAHSRGADGRDRVGVMPKAYFVWFTLPATERESAIIQVIRKAC